MITPEKNTMLTLREWITIEQCLRFTARYSKVTGKSKGSTDELNRVANIVKQIVEAESTAYGSPKMALIVPNRT